jgi:hypothetical protein
MSEAKQEWLKRVVVKLMPDGQWSVSFSSADGQAIVSRRELNRILRTLIHQHGVYERNYLMHQHAAQSAKESK